jgi:hypothetical protein
MSSDEPQKQLEEVYEQLEEAPNKQFAELQEQFEPITTLLTDLDSTTMLIDLGDGSPKYSLKQTHTSVLISFTQMLDYMSNTIKTIEQSEAIEKQKDILCLLQTFRDMALKYYTQFESTLLQELKNQCDLIRDADWVIQRIDEAYADATVAEKSAFNTTKKLLTESRDTAEKEVRRLKDSFPTLMQSALDKLRDEWQRLNTVAAASEVITKNGKLIETLDLVVEAARFSVGIDVSRIAVVPGDAFSLQFYAYLKNFAILTVPIYSVQVPWEWSIFWHELAGEKVRRLEKNTAFEIESIRENLKLIYDKWNKGDEEYRNRLLDFITRNNQYVDPDYEGNVVRTRNNHFGQKKLRDFFTSGRLNWRDLGGFEHQFERMLENLLSKDRFNQYEKIKADGWSVDWFKELFEDAWSVLAIREPFINFLDNILQRHVATDGRHPPVKVRVDVANKILELMSSEDNKIEEPETIEESAAQQILTFISLLITPSMERAFEMTQSVNDSVNDPNYWLSLRPLLADFVGSEIGKYIQKWFVGLSGDITLSETIKETSKNAEDFNNKLLEVVDFKKSMSTSSQQPLNELQASYDGLLQNEKGNPKDYRQLLELSFYDVDFGYPVGSTALFTFESSTWKVSAVNVVNHTTVFNFLSSKPAETQKDGIFSLKDNQNMETWYSISKENFANNKTKNPPMFDKV